MEGGMKRPNAAKMQSECDRFNAANSVGAPVRVMLDGAKEPMETRTRSKAEVLSGHSAVVLLEGVRGYYLLDRVTPM
jgi:hypothetical protein